MQNLDANDSVNLTLTAQEASTMHQALSALQFGVARPLVEKLEAAWAAAAKAKFSPADTDSGE